MRFSGSFQYYYVNASGGPTDEKRSREYVGLALSPTGQRGRQVFASIEGLKCGIQFPSSGAGHMEGRYTWVSL